jgi:hypothetical protein
MHLVELLLPLYDNEGEPFGPEQFAPVRDELSNRFGGLTAFTRAPAEGVWDDGGERHHDDVVFYEVMVDELDRDWWQRYRAQLEAAFRQDKVLIRAHRVELL